MTEEELTVLIEIVKIDEETGKSYSYKVPVPRGWKIKEEKTYKNFATPFASSICNVGDFMIFEDKVYRRIRGGIRPATDDDLAELLAAKLGEALEE